MGGLRVYTVSWFFAPYLGSADLDLWKRLKDTDCHYRIIQAKRKLPDARLAAWATTATFDRVEVALDANKCRTREVRDHFLKEVLLDFAAQPQPFDLLLSHSNEMNSHAAAAEIKRRHPKLPWVAYFGDLFRKNPYLRHIPNYPLVKEDAETEIQTLREADVVVVNNTYQRDLMFVGELAAFKHKAVVIPHCYEPSFYPPASTATPNKIFTILHAGTLYTVKRKATPVLHAIDRLLEIYPAYRGKFQVVFHGAPPNPSDAAAHYGLRNADHAYFAPAVDYFTSLELMQNANALLLIDGIFDLKEDGLDVNPFFPGKLTDYFGAGRPILGITMPKGPTADLLRQHGHITAGLALDRIAFALKRLIDGKVVPSGSYAEYTCSSVGRRMQDVFEAAAVRSHHDAVA